VSETPLHHIRGNRLVPAVVERALNSALSRGPGYERTPIGTAFDGSEVRGYYTDFREKTRADFARDPSRLPATPLIQHALGWWERHVHGEAGAREEFLRLCGMIEARAQQAVHELRWAIDIPVPKYGLTPPWYSALPQGQAASAFVRAHLATGEDHYAELARRAAAPLMAGPGGDLAEHTPQGPILEEAPSRPPSHILNGWMTASWALWDLRVGLSDTQAGHAFDATIKVLRARLPEYDTGRWSLYSLYPHPLPDLAKPIYHRFHVDQLEVCHRLTGLEDFRATAARWRSYDRPVNVALSLAHKAAFAAADAPRRRRTSGP
jgi:hypothetical protein